MNPQLVLAACCCLILWLFRMDGNYRPRVSPALLIPGAWIAILGSRPVSYWFGSGGEGSDSDGNPINTFIFAILIFAAVAVLVKRQFRWGSFAGMNKALFLIYLYMLISSSWSELPLVSAKRIFKDFGCVLTALVILTEADPAEAARTVFVRVSYILFPLSLVFGKYFPQIGRNYGVGGEPMFTGLTTQKNTLGQVLFVFGLMILWDLVTIQNKSNGTQRSIHKQIRIGMLLLGTGLLVRCGSQTSLVCLLVGVVVFWGVGRLVKMASGKNILFGCIAIAIALAALDRTFNYSDFVLSALGRNPTLTGRTEIWRLILNQDIEPVVGEGFYIFWDTSKGNAVVTALAHIKSAHNGYLEVYMDGGIIALVLLGGLILASGKRSIDRLFTGTPVGTMSIIFWLLAIICNLSESNFLRLTPLWFAFLLVTIECPTMPLQKLRPLRSAATRKFRPLLDSDWPVRTRRKPTPPSHANY